MEQITIKDVIRTSINELRAINIPASIGPDAMLGIAIPLARAMHNLEVCLKTEDERVNPMPEPDEKEIDESLIEEEKVVELPPIELVDAEDEDEEDKNENPKK